MIIFVIKMLDIGEMNEKYNTTVILTTHDMKDIENLWNATVFIIAIKTILAL